MASDFFRRAGQFLGLVEDYEDEYADLAPTTDAAGSSGSGADAPAAPRPEPSNVRRIPPAGGPTDETLVSRPAAVPPTGTVNVIGAPAPEPAAPSGPSVADRVHVTSPTAFNDVEEVGERFRAGDPVLMNLQGASEGVAKRILDFASGLIFGLDGAIDRTGDRIFLLTPAGVDIAPAEVQRLRDRGLLSSPH
jgi:cell division inhibitor SepF